MISFIVPAHNEEAWIGRCVSAIRNGAESLDEPHEIIVVADASTDATAAIARQQGAQVVCVEHRQIAATRDAGARQSHGDILFFVDADTLANAAAIQSAVRSIRAGAVGGGCVPRFEGWLPWWFRLTEPLIGPAAHLARFLPSGAFLFCARGAFQTAGGFDENYYAAEEVVFIAALKRQGRVVILPETVVTSGRKVCAHSFLSLAGQFTRLVLRGSRGLRRRRGLEYWYEPERDKTK
jgi:glycosyltransferase involved in cell wall biosynthesis